MKKKLYYTVKRGVDHGFDQSEDTLNGTKIASVYSIENNEPKHKFDVNMDLSDNTINHIKIYMNQNGIEEAELIIF